MKWSAEWLGNKHPTNTNKKTHAVDVQDPFPRFGCGANRPADPQKHQKEKRPGPEPRSDPVRTRTARHLSQEEEETSSTATETVHNKLDSSWFRETLPREGWCLPGPSEEWLLTVEMLFCIFENIVYIYIILSVECRVIVSDCVH